MRHNSSYELGIILEKNAIHSSARENILKAIFIRYTYKNEYVYTYISKY